jgi:hypothetical protein
MVGSGSACSDRILQTLLASRSNVETSSFHVCVRIARYVGEIRQTTGIGYILLSRYFKYFIITFGGKYSMFNEYVQTFFYTTISLQNNSIFSI